MIDAWKRQPNDELEVSLGKFIAVGTNHFKFDNSISELMFTTALNSFKQNLSAWSSVSTTTDIDLLYVNGDRETISNAAAPTSILIDGKKTAMLNLRGHACRFDSRIRTKHEEKKTKQSDLHRSDTIKMIRLKHRTRFVWKERFYYDFTIVKTTTNLQEAIRTPEHLSNFYEIELEVANHPSNRNENSVTLGQQLLQKSLQLALQLGGRSTSPNKSCWELLWK